MHHYEDLITIFYDCFFEKYNTQLVKGAEEPLYLPADEERPHSMLIFAHGFFASALHECSHWLIAGEERRKQVDFGYWYIPDGRSPSEQQSFLGAEIKPQALEWILSKAAGYDCFRLSVDNLTGSETDTSAFKLAVHQQVKTYCEKGLPMRAAHFRQALCHFYHTPTPLQFQDFDINALN